MALDKGIWDPKLELTNSKVTNLKSIFRPEHGPLDGKH